MLRARTAVCSAAAVVALQLAGCSWDSSDSKPPAPPPTAAHRASEPAPTGLPAPEVLTGVLDRLADADVPGADKLDLVEGATPADADTLDRFDRALLDNGYTPATFTAGDMAWSDANSADVTATITVTRPDGEGGFSLPMEFRPYHGGWQLSEETFTLLLHVEAP